MGRAGARPTARLVCAACGRETMRAYREEGFGPCRCGGALRRAPTRADRRAEAIKKEMHDEK